jgi:hypothetical protein
VRNVNGIMLSFRGTSCPRSELLRERPLMRGRLPSFPYLTWLSLPFQFFFILWFATYSCSLGAGIYALSLFRDFNDFNGLFFWTGGKERAGGFCRGPGQRVPSGGNAPVFLPRFNRITSKLYESRRRMSPDFRLRPQISKSTN